MTAVHNSRRWRAFVGLPVARRLLLVCALALAAAGWAAATPSAARAAVGDIGYQGPSTVGAQAALTGEKPESKLWWNDGSWWASMWSQPSSAYHIFRLNLGSQSWVDTGVGLDNRSSSRADTLWDAGSGKLYVASHVFSTGSSSGNPARLYRYGYNAATETYSLDAGFPVQIGNYKTEALTIAKDSTGQLWATWKQGTTFVVNASVCNPVCNDAVWGTPFTPNVPGTKTTFDSDDNSGVIAFAGKVGVLWSNQTNGTDYFAIHGDSDSDTTWAGETALSGPDMADDHMNLKTDSSGRVYAVVKTSRGGSTDPLVMLLVRNTSGSWTSTTVGLKRDHHTRAIVELDEVDQIIHVFATSPESGGSIYEKTSPMGSISFPGGQGTVVVQDADGKLNNSTSTKQNVSPATGLVVLASSGQRVYFHQYFSLGGSGGGGPSPTAAFSATPTSGAAPLDVQFTDTSSGGPTAWQWDFQNDGTVDSTQQNPSFVYANPGTYSVKLTVSNASGDDSVTKSSYITVTTAGPTLTFTPTDDAFVRANHPDENNGSLDTLRSWKGSGQTNSFLKFSVSGVTGAVSSAKLRLYVVQQSPSAGNVFPVADTSWAEGTITWATSPTIGSTRIGQGGPASLGTWIEIDLGSAISGNGTVSLALVGASNTAAWLSSREGANPPQLVLTQS